MFDLFSRLINFQLTIPHWRMSKHLLSFWTLKKPCKYAYFHFNVILYCLPFQNDIKVLIMISCYVDNPEIIEMVVLFRLFWQDLILRVLICVATSCLYDISICRVVNIYVKDKSHVFCFVEAWNHSKVFKISIGKKMQRK